MGYVIEPIFRDDGTVVLNLPDAVLERLGVGEGDIVYLLGEQQAVTSAMELLETGRVKTSIDPEPAGRPH